MKDTPGRRTYFLRALLLGDALADVVKVIFVGLERAAEAFHFNATNDVGHFALVEENGTSGGEPWDKLVELDDGGAEVGPKLGVSGEDDEWEKIILRQREQRSQCFEVAVVLVTRVSEPGFLLVNGLGPLALVLVAEDPALVVLCFENENAGGHD